VQERGLEHDDAFTEVLDVLDVLTRIRDGLQGELRLQPAARLVVRAAQESVPGAEFAGLIRIPPSTAEGGRIEIVVGADPRIGRLVGALNEAGTGPAFELVAGEAVVVRVDDLATDSRWGDLGAHLGVPPMDSLLLYRVPVPGERGLALLLAATPPGAFDLDGQRRGLLVATVASIALTGVQRAEQLRLALTSRDVIGQAKGMLRQRWQLSEQAAFSVLSRISMDGNEPLREVAARMVEDGAFPVDPEDLPR
jgi:hypothetical protein